MKMPSLMFICISLAVSGCARTTQSVTKPSELYELNAGAESDGYAVTYDARGRGAYLVQAEIEEKDGSTKKRSGLVFCAEPPPDAAANLSADRTVNADIDALVKLKVLEVGATAGGSSQEAASSEIAEVATRTELVLLMRDAMYRICEMNANGVLSDEKAEEIFGNVLSTARTLGQRDNVGKLIDVLSIVASSPAENETTADLVESLTATIRLVVLGEQLMQSDEGTNGLVTMLIVSAVLNEIGAMADDEVKGKMLELLMGTIKDLQDRRGTLKRQLEDLSGRGGRAERDEKKRIEQEIKEIDEQLEQFKATAKSLGFQLE